MRAGEFYKAQGSNAATVGTTDTNVNTNAVLVLRFFRTNTAMTGSKDNAT
jgi:hypothetical protein